MFAEAQRVRNFFIIFCSIIVFFFSLQHCAFQQSKAAERYLKRLEFHLTRVEEVQEQYELSLKAPIPSNASANGSVSRNTMKNGSADNKRSPNSSQSIKNGTAIKELSQILTKLETELELLLGTLSIQLKGTVPLIHSTLII